MTISHRCSLQLGEAAHLSSLLQQEESKLQASLRELAPACARTLLDVTRLMPCCLAGALALPARLFESTMTMRISGTESTFPTQPFDRLNTLISTDCEKRGAGEKACWRCEVRGSVLLDEVKRPQIAPSGSGKKLGGQ